MFIVHFTLDIGESGNSAVCMLLAMIYMTQFVFLLTGSYIFLYEKRLGRDRPSPESAISYVDTINDRRPSKRRCLQKRKNKTK